MSLSYGCDAKSELLYLTSLVGRFLIGFMVVGFVRSGNLNLPGVSGATFRNAGINGYGWSSRAAAYTSSTAATAYNLGFNASDVYPSNGPNNRWNGFPLRWYIMPRRGADLFINKKDALEWHFISYYIFCVNGMPDRSRTYDTQLRKLVLYPLSYGHKKW